MATVGNLVWHDLNADGLKDASEPGVKGAVVELLNSSGGSLGVQITDGDGAYRFENLDPGEYQLAIRPAIGFGLTTLSAGSDATINSDFSPVTMRTSTFTLDSADNLDLDAGLTGNVPGFGFAAPLGGTGTDRGQAIATDQDGNVYVAGAFSGTVDFDPGPGQVELTAETGEDIFVAKYTNDGALVWARSVRSSGDHDEALGVVANDAGDVYVTGRFAEKADFDPGPDVLQFTADATGDAFVWKLDKNGALKWAKQAGGSGDDVSRAIALDSSGNVVTTGNFAGTVDFDPSAATASLTSQGSSDVFAWKLNQDGDFLWARSIAGTGTQNQGRDVAVDSAGNVLVGGQFNTTAGQPADFDPSTAVFPLSSQLGSVDGFVWKLDINGDFVWALAVGGGEYDSISSIATGGTLNLYATGSFTGTADFDPRDGSEMLVGGAGSEDVFVWKVGLDGVPAWVRTMGGASTERGLDIAVRNSQVVLTGRYLGAADFNPGRVVYNLPSYDGDDSDTFVSKLDANGRFLLGRSYRSDGDNQGLAVAADRDGNVFTTGYYRTTTDFNSGSGTFALANEGGTDGFLARITLAPASSPTTETDNFNMAEDTLLASTSSLLANDESGSANLDVVVSDYTDPQHGTVVVNADGTFSYRPNADYFGADTFRYLATNGNQLVNTDVTVTVANVNDAPVLAPDRVEINEDPNNPPVINVLVNDGAGPNEADPLRIIGVLPGPNGQLVIQDNAIVFIPNANFFGVETFNYVVEDVIDGSPGRQSTGAVTVVVAPVNDPPSATNDRPSMNEDAGPLTIRVLDNDNFGPDNEGSQGDALTITQAQDPAHGSVTISDDKQYLIYTPDPGYFGVETFDYTIDDGHSVTATGAVTVTVMSVNDDPSATNDEVTIDEDSGEHTISVLGNDLVGAGDESVDTLSVTAVGQAAHGTAALVDGAVKYTPAANYFGDDQFTYDLSDGNGGTARGTVTMHVRPVNDLPVANDDEFDLTEDQPATLAVLANDHVGAANETTDVLTIDMAAVPASVGTLTVAEDRRSLQFTPAANFFGDATFSYFVRDGAGGFASAEVTMHVANVNDNPHVVDDTFQVDEDSRDVPLDVRLNDWPQPENEVSGETYTIASVTQPQHGSVTLNGSDIRYTPAPNYTGSDEFTYTVRDSHGGEATARVQINVNNVDDDPTANNDSFTVTEDSGANSLNVLDNDLLSPTQAGFGTLSVSSAGPASHGTTAVSNDRLRVLYTPAANFFGQDVFVYRMADSGGGEDTATVTITVTNVNDPPVANRDEFTVDEDSRNIVLNIRQNDADGPGESETLTVTEITAAQHGVAAVNDGVVTYTPSADYFGEDSFTYTLRDASGASATGTVAITVREVNDSPTANRDEFYVQINRQNNSLDVLANDSFGPANEAALETRRITNVTTPEHGTVSIVDGTSLSYTPTTDFEGADEIRYTISDGRGGTATATATITVANLLLPSAKDDSFTIAEDSGANTLVVLANDRAGLATNTIFISAVSPATHGTVSIAGNLATLRYTPQPNYFGIEYLTYTVSDGVGNTDRASVTITVTNVNDPPVADDDSLLVAINSPGSTLDVLANDHVGASNEVDVDNLTITSFTTPRHGTLAIAPDGKSLTYVPNVNYVGAETFDYTISDGSGGTDTATVSLIVSGWQNPLNSLDVNGDGFASPLDALLIINELNNPRVTGANRALPPPVSDPPAFFDVNGDGFVTALDALIIINQLNRPRTSPSAEGEPDSPLAPAQSSSTSPTPILDALGSSANPQRPPSQPVASALVLVPPSHLPSPTSTWSPAVKELIAASRHTDAAFDDLLSDIAADVSSAWTDRV